MRSREPLRSADGWPKLLTFYETKAGLDARASSPLWNDYRAWFQEKMARMSADCQQVLDEYDERERLGYPQ